MGAGNSWIGGLGWPMSAEQRRVIEEQQSFYQRALQREHERRDLWRAYAPGEMIPVTRPEEYIRIPVPPNYVQQDIETEDEKYHRLARARRARLKKLLEERKEGKEEGIVINKFLVGCDPEFVALDEQNRIIPAAGANGEIGYDHGGRVWELRPAPTKGTFALVKRLQRLIQDNRLRQVKGKFRAGGIAGGQPLGGHVHFGIEPFQELTEYTGALDTTTRLLEHLDILPKTESQNRRRGTYGKFGDWRTAHDGQGHAHLEYRTMASWLYDPKVAFLCLTAAKLATADPKGTLDALKHKSSYSGLLDWIAAYRSRDANAARVYERIGDAKLVQVNPDVDFRERWERLGL